MIQPDNMARTRPNSIFATLLAGLLVVPSAPLLCSQQASAAAPASTPKPDPPKAGSYSLVVTTLEPTAATHLLNPAPTVDVKGGTRFAPAATSGNLTVPSHFTIEDFGKPRLECDETAGQQHGCDALDQTDLTIRDPNSVEYRVTSHGAAVKLEVNLEVHDLLPTSHAGPAADWHSGDVVFVSVPKATPAYRFISETLVGQWNGAAVVFEPGKPLPESAKKGLEDLGIHQDLGDAVLYSYRVK